MDENGNKQTVWRTDVWDEAQAGSLPAQKQLAALRKDLAKSLRGYRVPADDLEDVLQEAMTRIWKAWPRIDFDKNPGGYCFTIAKNLLLGYLLLRKTHPSISIDQVPDRPVIQKFYDGVPEVFWACVNKLSSRLREPFVLHHVDDLSNEEVAEVLHIPLNTAKTNVARAKGKLREMPAFQALR